MGIIDGVKMMKMKADKCFGEKYETHEQCENCWIKQSCLVRFRNKK